MLGFGVLVNYFDRVNLSVSQDALRAAFGISPVMFGYLSSAYSWTYAACQLPAGLLLDRFGVKMLRHSFVHDREPDLPQFNGGALGPVRTRAPNTVPPGRTCT